MGMVLKDDKGDSPELENADFSDLQLIHHVRDALIAVTLVNHFCKLPRLLFNLIRHR